MESKFDRGFLYMPTLFLLGASGALLWAAKHDGSTIQDAQETVSSLMLLVIFTTILIEQFVKRRASRS